MSNYLTELLIIPCCFFLLEMLRGDGPDAMGGTLVFPEVYFMSSSLVFLVVHEQMSAL